MKKLIASLVLILISFNIVNSQTLKSISSSENILKIKDTLYSSLSFGTGICIDNSKLNPSFEINAGIRHQFSQSFYLEGKFDYIPAKNTIYILSLIPQWSLYNNKTLNFVLGAGLDFIAYSKEAAIIFPLAIAKLEINITDNFFIFPEFRFPPFLASVNFGYRIPSKL
ncbi:MAG: hypothetical protein WC139_03875 [Candidatus Kapaibacterium sp.]